MLSQKYKTNNSACFNTRINSISGLQSSLSHKTSCSLSELQRHARLEEHKYHEMVYLKAVLIQKAIRKFNATCKLTYLKQEKEKRIKNNAATKIQCAVRIYFAKRLRNYLAMVKAIQLAQNQASKTITKFFKLILLQKRSKTLSLVHKLLKTRFEAACFIQKLYKGHLVRKDLSFSKLPHKNKLVQWKYPAQTVFLIGSFTSPPWKVKIPMQHSRYLNCHYTTYFMDSELPSGKYFFKFEVDSIPVCDGYMPISEDPQGNYTNIINIPKKSKIPRALSTRSIYDDSIVTDIVNSNKNTPRRVRKTLSGNLGSPRALNLANEATVTHNVKVTLGACMVAHPKQQTAPLSPEGSADAYFIEEEKQIFGLADGVGEWETFGLDPSLFPNELMHNCKLAFEKSEPLLKKLPRTEVLSAFEQVLYEGYAGVESYGSSTALLVYCKDSYLFSLCLGDSGYMVLRERETKKYSLVYRSCEQQHSFNCPLQLAQMPKKEDYNDLLKKGLSTLVTLLKRAKKTTYDSPFDSVSESIVLKLNDLIIAGTDGLFDNLFDTEILETAESFAAFYDNKKELVQKLAEQLSTKAVEKGWDSNYKSPFSRNATKHGRKHFGGKLDDTTVIVGIALAESN